MDSVHDRASIIAEEDRISNLPDEIIHHILSFLDMKYAIQTSKLSRKWKHIWTSMPHLNLNSQRFRTLPQFAKFVKHALSHRNYQIEVSVADVTLTGSATQFVVKSIVNYAYSHNVRELTMTWFTMKVFEFPQRLFRSHTLKRLTLATKDPSIFAESSFRIFGPFGQVPKSAWDFPALETLSLTNMQLGDSGDKSLNLFSKCVNLKDLTLHRFSMLGLDIFNVCAPQLSNLTITYPIAFPRVFNVVAPQLKNLIASVRDVMYSEALQLSTEGFDSLEKVNLSLTTDYKRERYLPQLLDLFQKLRSAKFLILDVNIIESLSSCLGQLSYGPCPFDKLKCLKIDTVQLMQKEHITTRVTQVRNYLLENSPSATFIMDLPQEYNLSNHSTSKKVPQKRSRQRVNKDTKAKKVAKLEEEKQQLETMMAEEKRKMHDELIAQEKAILETMKLQHEKFISQIIKCKMTELRVQVEGGNPDYELIHLLGCDIKSIIDLTPESLRVAIETQFYCQYEEVKSMLITRIDASQWAKIETELGSTRHSERIHSNNIHSQSNVRALALPPAP